MFTSIQLVKYCEKCLGREYWYGCFGNKSTKDLLSRKRKQYPQYYNAASYKKGWTCDGNPVYDCIGLIKSFLWTNNTYGGTPTYKSSQDVNVGGMIDICKTKGSINTLPEVPGTLLFINRTHVGVYVGDGYAIEARGHDYGVVKTKVKGRGWTSWGYCPWISYGPEEDRKPTEDKVVNQYTHKVIKAVNVRKSSTQLSSRVYYDKYPGYIKNQIRSLKGESCDYLPEGTLIKILETKRGWYRIGADMWIAGNYTTGI